MGLDIWISLFDVSQYGQRVEPALRKYFETSDCTDILLLLNEVKSGSRSDSEMIQSSIDILNGVEFYGPSVSHIPTSPQSKTSREDLDTYVRWTVVSQVLEGLCVPHKDGGPWEQNMGRSALIPYLYEHSSWIEDAFTGGILDKGVRLDFSIGEHSEILAPETVKLLLSELHSVPRPDPSRMPQISAQLSRLLDILEIATRDSTQVALLYIR